MADIDGGYMGSTTLKQHLRETACRSADVQSLRTRGIKLETIEPGDQLQRGSGDVIACGVIHRQIDIGRHILAGFGHHRSADRDGAALDRIAGA